MHFLKIKLASNLIKNAGISSFLAKEGKAILSQISFTYRKANTFIKILRL